MVTVAIEFSMFNKMVSIVFSFVLIRRRDNPRVVPTVHNRKTLFPTSLPNIPPPHIFAKAARECIGLCRLTDTKSKEPDSHNPNRWHRPRPKVPFSINDFAQKSDPLLQR